ncbi:MAG TPA: RecQ family ATP-dependent DNA helicase [Chthoniobacterales bacterium]|jgi:ATP-dependent DNA helicase RecQ|nr:RecQ family ATP-dependent DNA helicase [Chthoniobacterales bacterium]
MTHNSPRALELLRLGTLYSGAAFREDQESAISHVVEARGRLLVVQKTGWGKSSVYFIATKLLREQGAGPALLISPLLALMRNQIAAAERMGVRALTINSENVAEWEAIESKIARDEVDILLISPERLANEHFRNDVLGPVAGRISLLVVDEAHCISDWGHDFRPHYRFIEGIVRRMPANLRLLATTATANNRVLDDLQTVLGPNLTVSRGELSRSSLLLQTMRIPSQAERMAWLATHIPNIAGSGIVYTLTVRDTEQVAEWLRSREINAQAYSGQSGSRRVDLENALLENRVKVLVATTALGMGFDKPDLAFVIHYQTPGSVVGYYQQVGRAGRALAAAHGVLLSGHEETEINEYFIESAFPSRAEVAQVLDALHRAPAGLTVSELMRQVNVSKGRIDKTLLLLSLESPAPIAKQGTKWTLTAAELGGSFWERAERLTALRRTEQAQMQEYVGLQNGHMEFLIRALDGDASTFRPPNLQPLPAAADPELVQQAMAFLRRTSLPLEPRKVWPSGGLPHLGVKGKIAPEHQLQPGKIVCVWGDAGWGDAVRLGKYHDRHFGDDLVAACVELVRQWNPQPAPRWVTCIPSRRHPDLVPDFARRLAAALALPFQAVLDKTDDRAEQKTMANSVQQARNIDGSLAINTSSVPAEPLLLIDDMVDSKWTLTVAAYLLTSHGSGPVYPLALASTGHAE